MKTSAIKLTILAIAVSSILTACKKKSNPSLEPQAPINSKTITVANLTNNYFVIQKNVGKPLAVISFQNENGIKFYYDAAGTRRIGTPTIENIDTIAGTALAKIDLDGNGVDVFEFSLKKSSDRTLNLTQTKFHDLTTTIISTNIYNVKDLDGFSFEGLHLNSTIFPDTYNYDFTSTLCTYSHIGGVIEDDWDGIAPYYSLSNNVGFKMDNVQNNGPIIGAVWKKTSGKIGVLIDNSSHGVLELEK